MLEDFKKSAAKKLSWAFNNNGNEVDKTRIRFDSSPLHSTGVTWLASQWEAGVAATTTALVMGVTSDASPAALKVGVGASVLSAVLAYAVKWNTHKVAGLVGTEHELCINKNPAAGQMTSPEHAMNIQVLANTTNKITPFMYLAAGVTYGAASGFGIKFSRDGDAYDKILAGKWVIEEAPKPQKKAKKEKADELGNMAAQYEFAPIPGNRQ